MVNCISSILIKSLRLVDNAHTDVPKIVKGDDAFEMQIWRHSLLYRQFD